MKDERCNLEQTNKNKGSNQSYRKDTKEWILTKYVSLLNLSVL